MNSAGPATAEPSRRQARVNAELTLNYTFYIVVDHNPCLDNVHADTIAMLYCVPPQL